MDMILKAQPNRAYMIASPTGVVMGDTTLPTFLELADGWIARATMKPWPTFWFHNKAEIRFRTADDPERMRGPNLSGVWLDEASLMKHDAFLISIGCLRQGNKLGWLSATFTPKGKQNWTYEVFGKESKNTALFRSSTSENVFLPEGFDEVLRSQYTSTFAAQELGGEFLDPAGTLFDSAWFRLVEESPRDGTRVRYWDKAGTEDGGDYTAGVLMCRDANRNYWVEDVVRGQWSSLTREQMILDTAKLDRQRHGVVTTWVEQEPGSGGKDSAEATVKNLSGFIVKLDKVSGSKEDRAMPFAAQAEAGNVRVLLRNWTKDYIDEIGVWPNGKFLDQGDASSGAFNKLSESNVGVPLRSANNRPRTILNIDPKAFR